MYAEPDVLCNPSDAVGALRESASTRRMRGDRS